jgi:hypothetical protein
LENDFGNFEEAIGIFKTRSKNLYFKLSICQYIQEIEKLTQILDRRTVHSYWPENQSSADLGICMKLRLIRHISLKSI